MQNVLSNVSEYHITLWIGPPSAITFSGIFKSAPIHHLIVTTLLESLSRLSSFEEPRMVLHGKIPTSIIDLPIPTTLTPTPTFLSSPHPRPFPPP